MYYFDHKIADYVSSFPTVYQIGIIQPDKVNNPTEIYDDTLNESKTCHKQTYIPFVENCNNKRPTMFDISGDESKHASHKLCIVPWYKIHYDVSGADYSRYPELIDATEVEGQMVEEDSSLGMWGDKHTLYKKGKSKIYGKKCIIYI